MALRRQFRFKCINFSALLSLSVFLILVQTSDSAWPIVHDSVCRITSDQGGWILKRYHSSKQMCCNGKLHNKVYNKKTDIQCCDDKILFDSHSKVCCGSHVHDRFVPKTYGYSCTHDYNRCVERECCGSRLTLKTNAICCNDTEIELTKNDAKIRHMIRCCGKDKYSLYDPNFRCEGGQLRSRTEWPCGDKYYNPREQGCCGGNVIQWAELKENGEKNPKFDCCGSVFMEPQTYKCCHSGSHVNVPYSIFRLPNLECCGNTFYNKNTELCINNQKQEKKENTDICGKTIIDLGVLECCANSIPYNPKESFCCEGANFSVLPNGHECCNGFSVKENELCCEGRLPVVKTNPEDNHCCYNKDDKHGKTFQKGSAQSCHEGTVRTHPASKTNEKPCGPQHWYNPAHELCCGMQKFTFNEGFIGCCDNKPYTISQQCCKGSLSQVSREEGLCCFIDGRVYLFGNKSNPCRQRCGKEFFYEGHDLCCNDKVHKFEEGKKCCEEDCLRFASRKTGLWMGEDEILHITQRQQMCEKFLKDHFNRAVQHACKDKFVLKGTITEIKVQKIRHQRRQYAVFLNLTNVQGQQRGSGFRTWHGDKQLQLEITLIKTSGKICKGHAFKAGQTVYIFMKKGAKHRSTEKRASSGIYLTKVTRKMVKALRVISKPLCRDVLKAVLKKLGGS